MANKIPQGNKAKLKGILFIGNVFISVVSIIAVIGYFIMPLWEVKMTINMTPAIVEMIQPKESGQEEEESSSDGQTDMTSEIMSALADANLSISMGITLDSSSFVSAVVDGDARPVESIIDRNVRGILDDFAQNIENAIAPIMKSVAVSVITEQVKNALKESLSEGANLDEETRAALEELDIDEEYIETKVETVINALTDENATVEDVSDTIMGIYDEIVGKIESSETYGDNYNEMSEEDKEAARNEIKNAIEEVLEMIAAEDGSINLDDILGNLILTAMEESESGGEETASAYSSRYYSNVAYADEEENPEVNIAEKIRETVMEKLDDESLQTIAMVMKVVGYVILFTFFTWAYLILKILVKIGAKNPGIKLKLPIWLGWLPCLVLVILPTALISGIKSGAMASVMGEGAETAQTVLDAISITFKSGSTISLICAGVLLVFSFFYGHYRRQLKKIIKYEKKNGIIQ